MRVVGALVVMVLVVPWSITGCKKQPSVTYIASCDKRDSLSECSEYASELVATRKPYFKKSCDAAQGQFHDGACVAQTTEVGVCTMRGERGHFYSDGRVRYSSDSGAQHCKVAEGTWAIK